MLHGAAETATSSSEGQRFLKSSKMADTVNFQIVNCFCFSAKMFVFLALF